MFSITDGERRKFRKPVREDCRQTRAGIAREERFAPDFGFFESGSKTPGYFTKEGGRPHVYVGWALAHLSFAVCHCWLAQQCRAPGADVASLTTSTKNDLDASSGVRRGIVADSFT
jgi:hypothetical protein